jgi:hypothetical protein
MNFVIHLYCLQCVAAVQHCYLSFFLPHTNTLLCCNLAGARARGEVEQLPCYSETKLF